MREMDFVALTRDLPDFGLQAGDVGIVVLAHRAGVGYEVEFKTLAGRTLAVVALHERDVRPVDNEEVPHTRRGVTATGGASGVEPGSSVEIFPGITLDPGVRSGRPCLKATRVDVATVVGAFAAGESTEAVEQAYALTREQVLNALRYASHAVAHLPPAVGKMKRLG